MTALRSGSRRRSACRVIVRASEVIIEELLACLLETPVRHLVLALVGDEAQRLFYERLVRANAPRCAASSLRRIEKRMASPPTPAEKSDLSPGACAGATVGGVLPGPPGTADAAAIGAPPGGPQAVTRAVAMTSPPAKQGAPDAGPDDRVEISGEQFPSLVDETRVAAMPAGSPRLVAGLAALALRHADPADVEQELLSRPEC
jgi:hypothetical protein